MFFIHSFASDPPYHTINSFGTNTRGGTEETVVKVTNLQKSGPGSLADALSLGNRLVVFEVGGVIDMEGTNLSAYSNTTIAGQTAPYPGITIIRGKLSVRGEDIVIQHIKVRPGDQVEYSGDGISGGYHHIVLDHCSITWATDENTTIGGGDITFYRCLIAEGLSNSINLKGEHSCGTLIFDGAKNISVIGSLYAHNYRRNPRLKNGVTALVANCVIYNYGIYAAHIGDQSLNAENEGCGKGSFVGNTCLKGADGWDNYFLEGHKGDFDKTTQYPGGGIAYMEDNLLADRLNKENALIPHDENILLDSEPIVWPEAFIEEPSEVSLFKVLRSAGARAGARDTIDSRIVKSVINGTGRVIDSQDEVGGYPSYDSTGRAITVPSDINKRQAWLDSLSAAIDADTSLNIEPLEEFLNIKEYPLKQTKHYPDNLLFFYPNPVRETLSIECKVLQPGRVKIDLYDISGRYIQTIYSDISQAGWLTTECSIENLTNGVYTLRVEFGTGNTCMKLIKH